MSNACFTGMDAQVSYAFHYKRKKYPEKFKNQLANQVLVDDCCLYHHSYLSSVFTLHHRIGVPENLFKAWMYPRMVLYISFSSYFKVTFIRSVVCLNLPSFSGGLNPWGTPDKKKQRDVSFSSYQLDLTPPFVDDGLLEVVGFKDGWHGFVLLAPGGHGTRLAQARCIQFKFRKGAGDHAYMRIDGEPWKQPLLQDKDKVVVEISHLGQVSILATDNCIAKSVYDVSTQPDEESTSEDSDNSYSEERKKFGAADAFRYYDDIDRTCIS
ncbi:hypothetical protein GW17_00030378 [Ensete ventricosum]|nr:hypothetical protein GW17_00030378 [Ensete ventricosum]